MTEEFKIFGTFPMYWSISRCATAKGQTNHAQADQKHEEISSLHVSAVFITESITGLCNHSFVFSPFSQSIYKRKNQIFSALFNRIQYANINIFLTAKLCNMPSRDRGQRSLTKIGNANKKKLTDFFG